MATRRVYQPGVIVPGTVYRVVRLLGEGGMGLVYEVVDTTVDAPYVMKTLHRDLIGRKDLARRMQDEAKTLAKLRHPNIVRVYTAGTTGDDVPFYIMDKLDGQSLRLLLKRKGNKLPMANAIVITVQLLNALDKAHEHSVIHRDVKPDNIFLHVEGGETSTKLLDFGVMALIAETSRDTGKTFQGTLRYASPEQVAGIKVSAKTDLYATALVLYEMIAGRGPFADGKTDLEIARAHLNDDPPPLSRFVPDLRPDLDALVLSALAKNPDARPRDAFRFATELREIGARMDQERGGETLANTTLDTLVGELHDAMGEPRPPRSSPSVGETDKTDVGMPAPQLEKGTLENAPPSAGDLLASLGSATKGAGRASGRVDRVAPTRTAPGSTPNAPRHGTEPEVPFALAPTAPSPPPPERVASGPRERHTTPSYAGPASNGVGARSIGGSIPPPSMRRRALGIALVALLGALGVLYVLRARAPAIATGTGTSAERPAAPRLDLASAAASAIAAPAEIVPSLSPASSAAAPQPDGVATNTSGTVASASPALRHARPTPTPTPRARAAPSSAAIVATPTPAPPPAPAESSELQRTLRR